MKNFVMIIGIILGIESFAAQSIDDQNVLISKFERVLKNTLPSDDSYVPVSLRLADLYSERARKIFLKEVETSCNGCDGGKKDRTTALKLYEKVFPSIRDADEKNKVMVQIGHLYELTGQEEKAIEKYKLAANNERSPKPAQAQARMSLAEILFKRQQFSAALANYEKAVVLDIPQKGLAQYRVAWCLFHLGDSKKAVARLKNVLSNPSLITRSLESQGTVDPHFHEELARDLAVFLAKSQADLQDVEDLYRLSPEATKLDQVFYLAKELERVGEKKTSEQAWRFLFERDRRREQRLEAHIHLANLQMDLGNSKEALNNWDAALELSSDNARLKSFLLKMYKAENGNFSDNLLSRLQAYLEKFSGDLEILGLVYNIHRAQKKWPEAIENLDQLHAGLKKQKLSPETKAALENNLLQQIEVAELSSDKSLQRKIYDKYLSLSESKSKQVDVLYQKSYLLYKEEKYAEAAPALRHVAMISGKGAEEIKLKSANLALDALAILKDHQRIEEWTAEFSKKFPESKQEFSKLARQSVYNQVSVASSGNDPNWEVAWNTLAKIDPQTVSADERVKYYKDKLILAEKLKKYSEAKAACESLLAISNLENSDKQFALSRKAWLAELSLDFKTAFAAIKEVKVQKGQEEAYLLKTAMIAELADQDPTPFYDRYLSMVKERSQIESIVSKLVRRHPHPEKEIEKRESLLRQSPDILAGLRLEILGNNVPQEKKFKTYLKAWASDTKTKTSAQHKIFERLQVLDETVNWQNKLSQHKLESGTQKKLESTLKERIKLLESFEKFAQKAIESKDWIPQVVTLTYLKAEYERAYSDILSLPMPKGLTPEQETEYLTLLTQQAGPYKVKSTEVSTKIDELWARADIVDQLTKDISSQTGALRVLAVKQVSYLKDLAPESYKKKLISVSENETTQGSSLPTEREVADAREAVKKSPEDLQSLKILIDIEKRLGRETMAAYLQARAESLEKK